MAMEDLDLERVILFVEDGLENDLLAGAGPDGIYIRRDLVTGEGVFAAATLLEEMAHYKMHQLGATHSGLTSFPAALIHEFFGAWYSWTRLLPVLPDDDDRFYDGPIPLARATADVGYTLGNFLGAAAAGVQTARRRVDTWFEQAVAEPGVKELAARLGRMAADARTPSELACGLARLFPPR